MRLLKSYLGQSLYGVRTGGFEMLVKMTVRVGTAYIGAWATIALVMKLVA